MIKPTRNLLNCSCSTRSRLTKRATSVIRSIPGAAIRATIHSTLHHVLVETLLP